MWRIGIPWRHGKRNNDKSMKQNNTSKLTPGDAFAYVFATCGSIAAICALLLFIRFTWGAFSQPSAHDARLESQINSLQQSGVRELGELDRRIIVLENKPPTYFRMDSK